MKIRVIFGENCVIFPYFPVLVGTLSLVRNFRILILMCHHFAPPLISPFQSQGIFGSFVVPHLLTLSLRYLPVFIWIIHTCFYWYRHVGYNVDHRFKCIHHVSSSQEVGTIVFIQTLK